MALVEGTTAPLKWSDVAADRGPQTPDQATEQRGRRPWLWLLLIAVVLAGATVGLAYRHSFAHQIAISVSRQSTPFTELYFTHSNELPNHLVAPGPDTFSFTVVNSEGRRTDYAYTVTLTTPSSTVVVSQGTLRVEDGGTLIKTVDVIPQSSMTDFEVTVRLGLGEVIHFQGGAA